MILTSEQKELKALISGVLKDFFANPASGATTKLSFPINLTFNSQRDIL